MTIADNQLAQVWQRLGEQQREEAGRSLEFFARSYLPDHFSVKPSRMHDELFGLLEQASLKRGAHMAIAAPRGHAKSTIVSLAYVLWSVCYDKEPFIVLISESSAQANDLLRHVKHELESNMMLRRDFPGVCEAPGSRPSPPRWRQDELITRSGARVTALGVGKKIRGRRHGSHRPSLLILDDVESEEQARSSDRRENLADWFTKSVLKSGIDTTNAVVIGTIVHYDALLSRLVDPKRSPGWTGHKYQAVLAWSQQPSLWETWEKIYNTRTEHEGGTGPEAALRYFKSNRRDMLKGTRVLWPKRESYYTLMELRVREGQASFDSEKQNEPVNPDQCLFRDEDLVFWDDRYEGFESLLTAIGTGAQFYGACDPSLGKAGRNRDDSAIITLLKDARTGILYVVDADIDRRPPDRIIDTICGYARMRRYHSFGIESNQFQDFLGDQLQSRAQSNGLTLPVQKINHTTDKLGRIQSLQPIVRAGQLQFSRQHRTLLNQLRHFPLASHDDGPDALEMAVNFATYVPQPRAMWL